MISLFVNLFFINEKFTNRIRARRDSKKFPLLLVKHLDSQAYKTASHHKFNYIPKLNDLVVKFRTAYLKIESKCVGRGIDSEEYWNLLNSKVLELIKLASTFIGSRPLLNIKKKVELIKSLVNESDSIEDKEKIFNCLDKFYKVCDINSNEGKIVEYDKKLNKIILRFTNKYYAKMDRLVKLNGDFVDKSREAVESLEDSAASFEKIAVRIDGLGEPASQELDKCKGNNKLIQEGVDNVKGSLYELEQKVYAVKSGEGQEGNGAYAKNSAQELSELSELIQAENEKEITRLRAVIENQKQAISELEEKLKSMVKELESDDTLSESDKRRNISIIESLRNNLRDAEHCITVLEHEVETLKSKTKAIDSDFDGAGEGGKPIIGQQDVDGLESVINNLREDVESKSLENELLKVVTGFASELFNGETYEDLALLLYETLAGMKINVVLKIYSPSRTFEVCAAGKIPAKLVAIIENLHVNETSVSKGAFFFKFKNFGGAAHAPNFKQFSTQEIEYILMVATLANRMFDNIRLISASKIQHQKLGECENNIKKNFSEVDSAFDKISVRSARAVEEGFKQVREVGRSSGLNATQIANLNRLEAVVLAEINSEKATKLKVKKSFLETLKELESIRF